MCLEKKTSKKRSESRHLSSSWRNWNPFILLVRMPAGAVVIKNGMAITQNLITELQYSSHKKWKRGPQRALADPLHCSIVYDSSKGKQQMFSRQNDTTWAMHVAHQTALRRQNSLSATRMKAYGMRLNKINWPQEHQCHMVLYSRGSTGTGFKVRKNGARGLQRE